MTTTPTLLTLACIAVAALASCRTAPPAPLAKPKPLTAPAQRHPPPSETIDPADVELAAIGLAESETREAINTARQEFETAAAALGAAQELLEQDPLPPGAKRPTQQEIEKLRAGLTAKHQRVIELYRAQVAQYDSYIAKNPHRWLPRHKLAWFCADMGDELAAAELWRQVIALNAAFPYAYNNLATLYNHLGRDMESVDLYLKAIELENTDPEFHFNLANVLSTHRGEVAAKFNWDLPRVFRESLKYYHNARSLDPQNYEYAQSAASHYILAEHFQVTNWADDALADWKYCLDLNLTPQQRSYCLTNMARIHLREKNDVATARKLLLDAQKALDTPAVQTLLKECDRRARDQAI